MAIISDFSSLMQLGVAIGFGLSVFRAPVDLKMKAIEEGIDQEWSVVGGLNTARAQELKGELANLKLDYHRAKTKIETLLGPFLTLTILGAVTNWTGLAYGAVAPSTAVTQNEQYLILFVAIFYFVFIFFALEIMSRIQLNGIRARLHNLRLSSIIL